MGSEKFERRSAHHVTVTLSTGTFHPSFTFVLTSVWVYVCVRPLSRPLIIIQPIK